MEARQKSLHLSDDQKSFCSQQHLGPTQRNNQLEDLGEQFQEINRESNIQVKYYQEFKKIYLTSYKLWTEIRKQMKIKDALAVRVTAMESQVTSLHKARRIEEQSELLEECQNDSKRRNNKRMRRTAQQIERKYVCMAQYCDRCYGSEGSLQQHIKLKHPQLYKKESQSQEF